MKTLTVGFSRSSGKIAIFSRLIMMVQGTNYSHCYLRYSDESTGKDMVCQASGLQVNSVSYSWFLTKETIVKEFPLQISDQAFQNIMGSCQDRLGQPYSMLQIFNTLAYIMFKKNPWDNQITGWDCVKLVAYELEKELGYKIPEDLDVITPKDLMEFLNGQNRTS